MENSVLAKPFTTGAVLRFTLPNIIMMVFLSLYTIVDGMFIARLEGEIALSAVNMFLPLINLQIAIGIMFGTGGSALIAFKLGCGNNRQAKEDFTSIVFLATVVGILFSIICLSFEERIIKLLGVSALQYAHFVSYANVLLYFSPMLFLQTVFQSFFITAGKPNLGLALTVLAGVANAVLDYLFMGPLQMGIAGAALATGIGYFIPAVTGLCYFTLCRKETLCFVKFKMHAKALWQTCTNGSSEMISNVSMAVTTFLCNIIFMRFWAEDGVAALTILSYFQFIFSSVFIGFSMGAAPIISFKYGAGEKEQLRKILRFGMWFICICSISVYLLSLLFANPCAAFFTDSNSKVYQITTKGFPLYALQFLFMGVSIWASGVFTALNNGLFSGIISFARTFLFLVSSLLILPNLWGEMGVWLATPVAEMTGVIVSLGFLIWGRKKYHYT